MPRSAGPPCLSRQPPAPIGYCSLSFSPIGYRAAHGPPPQGPPPRGQPRQLVGACPQQPLRGRPERGRPCGWHPPCGSLPQTPLRWESSTVGPDPCQPRMAEARLLSNPPYQPLTCPGHHWALGSCRDLREWGNCYLASFSEGGVLGKTVKHLAVITGSYKLKAFCFFKGENHAMHCQIRNCS